MYRQYIPNGLLAGIVALLLLGLVPPLFQLAVSIISDADGLAAVLTGYNIRACINTLWVGIGVSVVATILGFIVAFAIVGTHALGRPMLKALFLAPLFAPSIMPAIGLIYLIGSNGLILNTNLYGALGVFLGGLIFALPHATLQILVSLNTLDTRIIDAARSLGAGGLRRFVTVIVPHCRRGILNAILVTFVLTITDFGVPKLLGGSFPVLATEIYAQAIGSQNFAVAAFLSVWLLVPALLAFYFSSKLTQKSGAVMNSLFVIRPNTLRDQIFTVLAWLIVGFEVSTIAVVIYGSFVTFWPYEMQLTFDNYLFKNSTYGVAPWIHSIELAFGVAVIGTLLSYVGSYLVVRVKTISPQLVRLYRILTTLPLCIPGTVLGLGFALSFSGWPIFKGPVGSIVFLIFNTLIHLYTVAHLTSAQTMAQINFQYETVGKSLGVGTLQTIRRVVLPLSGLGMREVFCYLFASAMTTISAVVFLYTADSIVAAVAAIDMIDSGFISEGAAMSTLIFISALAVRLIALKIKK